MGADVGLWRGSFGDTKSRHATHVVWEAPMLVACVTGSGTEGYLRRSMSKHELDPVLAGALDRWVQAPLDGPSEQVLERWFAEVHMGFEALAGMPFVDTLAASAVAMLVHEDHVAIGRAGDERAWCWRAGQLTSVEPAAGGMFRKIPAFAGLLVGNTPPIGQVDTAHGDIFILVSGISYLGIDTAYMTRVLEDELDPSLRGGAQELADRIGKRFVRFAAAADRDNSVDVHVHARIALAIVWIN